MSKARSLFLNLSLLFALAIVATAARAQSIEIRQWQGSNAVLRQPDHVVASTMAEWRSLWARVGAHAPDVFEPGRTNAVGIFLGQRGPGHGVHVLTAVRRRERIMLVFEERGPNDFMLAQRTAPPLPAPPPPTARALSAGSSLERPASNNFAPSAQAFAPPPAATLLPAVPAPSPSMASRSPGGPPTSPWAIVLINRADLPITVEQRLFR